MNNKKTKILISIPNTKRSERFPRKNEILAEFTVKWLDKELKNLPDNWDVKVVEIISDLTSSVTPYQICRVDTAIAENHEEIVKFVHKKFRPHIHIHLQLTNFDRRLGLIKDSVTALVMEEADVVSSYCLWRDDTTWRIIQKNMFSPLLRSKEYLKLYDGAIYTFRKPKHLFDYKCRWEFIKNKRSPVTDIDYKEQFIQRHYQPFLEEIENH